MNSQRPKRLLGRHPAVNLTQASVLRSGSEKVHLYNSYFSPPENGLLNKHELSFTKGREEAYMERRCIISLIKTFYLFKKLIHSQGTAILTSLQCPETCSQQEISFHFFSIFFSTSRHFFFPLYFKILCWPCNFFLINQCQILSTHFFLGHMKT